MKTNKQSLNSNQSHQGESQWPLRCQGLTEVKKIRADFQGRKGHYFIGQNKSHKSQNDEGTVRVRLQTLAGNCSRVTNAIILRNVTGPYYSQSHFN
jgi:hypothetical protein